MHGPTAEPQSLPRNPSPAILGGIDHRRSRESFPLKVRRQRNDENRLKHSRQGVALPDYDRTLPGLLARAVWTKIGPRDFTTLTADPRDRVHPRTR